LIKNFFLIILVDLYVSLSRFLFATRLQIKFPEVDPDANQCNAKMQYMVQ